MAIGVAAAVNRSNEAATERAYFCSVFFQFFNFRKTQNIFSLPYLFFFLALASFALPAVAAAAAASSLCGNVAQMKTGIEKCTEAHTHT